MANIKDWLVSAASDDGEAIEAIVVGGMHIRGAVALPEEGKVLSAEDGLAILDVEFDAGYGAPECRSMFAWTASKVYFIREYDGSTDLGWVPRHPVAGAAYLIGDADGPMIEELRI